jgi:predicted DNA binding CopG/RHH family protein
MLKKLPILKTDKEAEDFVDNADLSEYDLSGFVPFKFKFEFAAKDERINMRLPSSLLGAVKAKAKEAGMPYQRFIRATLEKAVSGK